MWTLDKKSLPNDWTREFRTKHEAIAHLWKHLCGDCRRGISRYVGARLVKGRKPKRTSARDLLSTACGLEYEIYKSKDGPARRYVKVRRKP
jgi:hypothetical protein